MLKRQSRNMLLFRNTLISVLEEREGPSAGPTNCDDASEARGLAPMAGWPRELGAAWCSAGRVGSVVTVIPTKRLDLKHSQGYDSVVESACIRERRWKSRATEVELGYRRYRDCSSIRGGAARFSG